MDLTRRDFNRLTAAAFGGMAAGTVIGCGDGNENNGTVETTTDSAATADQTSADTSKPAEDDAPADGTTSGGDTKLVGGELPEHNACLGLNQCKEFGKNAGEHECAGQSTCATVSHDCQGMNSCKFLGACDGKVGANDCKEQGGCQVPMTAGEELWKQARAAFEKRMKAKGKQVGAAPLPESDAGA